MAAVDLKQVVSLSDIQRTLKTGRINSSLTDTMYGLNSTGTYLAVPKNNNLQGHTFLTRPNLNLTEDNILNNRKLLDLLTDDSMTIHRYVRAMLDPRSQWGGNEGINPIDCPLVDPLQCFIPVISNHLTTMTGWSDIVIPSFTSSEGRVKQQYSQIDGNIDLFEARDIDLTFENIMGSPILYLIYVWAYYGSAVFQGKMSPYITSIINGTIDYNTRIWRVVLDNTGQYVNGLASIPFAYPVTVPLGHFYDYDRENQINTTGSKFTIRFKAIGMEYSDPILTKEFNQTVIQFNPNMHDTVRDSSMVKIPHHLASVFNHRGYPRINPDNNEFEWYVSAATFKTLTK